MSEASSAPHSVAANAMNRTSTKLCLLLAARGSSSSPNIDPNFSIRPPHALWESSSESILRLDAIPPQIHMRFPCPQGGGLGRGVPRAPLPEHVGGDARAPAVALTGLLRGHRLVRL